MGWLAPMRRCSRRWTVLSVVAVEMAPVPGGVVDDQVGLSGDIGFQGAQQCCHFPNRRAIDGIQISVAFGQEVAHQGHRPFEPGSDLERAPPGSPPSQRPLPSSP